jgi:hypothetical protein
MIITMEAKPQLPISPVLKEAVELRIDELSRTKDAFIGHYQFGTTPLAKVDTIERVRSLLEHVSMLNPELEDDDDLKIMARYIKQASNNHAVPESKVLKLEQQLRGELGKHLSRLEISTLYCQLLREAFDAGDATASTVARPESPDLEDDFEVVEQELDEVLERFERETFTAEDIDVEELNTYLSSLLETGEDTQKLEELRTNIQAFEADLLSDGLEVDKDFVIWCIMDLLRTGLISEERKTTLEGYLQSPIALRELVSVLNIKSVRHYYKNSDKGLPVTTLQNAEGQYCIVIQEGVIDSLFLHALGMSWAMKLKSSLNQFRRGSAAFTYPYASAEEMAKRVYFLDRDPPKHQATPAACSVCHPDYLSAPMPPPPPMDFGMPPPPAVVHRVLSKKKQKVKMNPYWQPPPPPPPGYGSLISARHDNYTRQFFMSRLPTQNGCTPKTTSAEDIRANLMKTLAAERRVREALDGQAHAGSAHFTSLASSLPHQTILTVLKLLGFGQTTLEVFERFLSAKLNIGPAVRGAPDRVLPRARGVPEGHALELVFTEAVMFFLELAVHKNSGSILYRLKDTCYFVGSNEEYEQYENEVALFADTMGLEVELEDTQSIGFVDLDAGIQMKKVVKYAHCVKKKLQASKGILDWVRIWNSTVGTYAAHLFGPLANVFGKAHQDDVKESYNVIYNIIFDGGSLTSHVTGLLATHLTPGTTDTSFPIEALIYLPQAYGGLGINNPFITLSLASPLPEDSHADFEEYLEAEDLYYKRAADNYALLDADAYARKLKAVFDNDKTRINAALGPERDLTTFMTKQELTANREKSTYPNLLTPPGYPGCFSIDKRPSLAEVYCKLLAEPTDDMPRSDIIRDEVERLEDKGDMKSWRDLSAEDKWVLQLYGDECFEKFGGLEIWCGEHVPQEVLKLVRGTAWDDDDDSSSDMTEI